MKIATIEVTAGRTIPDPAVKYQMFRPEVSLRATLDDDDDPLEATRKLQALAEAMVDEQGAWLTGEESWRRGPREDTTSTDVEKAMDDINGVDAPF